MGGRSAGLSNTHNKLHVLLAHYYYPSFTESQLEPKLLQLISLFRPPFFTFSPIVFLCGACMFGCITTFTIKNTRLCCNELYSFSYKHTHSSFFIICTYYSLYLLLSSIFIIFYFPDHHARLFLFSFRISISIDLFCLRDEFYGKIK